MWICQNCETQNQENDQFCPCCGTKRGQKKKTDDISGGAGGTKKKGFVYYAGLIGFVVVIAVVRVILGGDKADSPISHHADSGTVSSHQGWRSSMFQIGHDDGTTESITLKYRDDTVVEMTWSSSFTAEKSSDEIMEAMNRLNTEMAEEYAPYSFITYSVKYSPATGKVEEYHTLSNLDNLQNVKQATELGLLSIDDVSLISYCASESNLLKQGYLKVYGT